jgi:hypothetical protein
MNQTKWNTPISQFIRVEILLLKMVAGWHPVFFISTGVTSSTFPIQPDFSQNQPAAITLNTGSPWTLSQSMAIFLVTQGLEPKSRLIVWRNWPYHGGCSAPEGIATTIFTTKHNNAPPVWRFATHGLKTQHTWKGKMGRWITHNS